MAERRAYAVEQRLRLIDFLLLHYGWVGRKQVADYFGVSEVQASLDIQEYEKAAPKNSRYFPATKTHTRLSTFERMYP